MDTFQKYGYGYLVLHLLVDLTLAIMLYLKPGMEPIAVMLLLACLVFATFQFFGIKNEQFSGRHGARVGRITEPIGYWIGFVIWVIAHVAFTVMLAI